jgi:hypothetical protein
MRVEPDDRVTGRELDGSAADEPTAPGDEDKFVVPLGA